MVVCRWIPLECWRNGLGVKVIVEGLAYKKVGMRRIKLRHVVWLLLFIVILWQLVSLRTY